jgi:hypothetical protein
MVDAAYASGYEIDQYSQNHQLTHWLHCLTIYQELSGNHD